MSTFKRIISFLLAVVMVMGMLPMPHVHAEENEEHDHLVIETVPSTTEAVPVETTAVPTTQLEETAPVGTDVPAETADSTAPPTEETIPVTEETVPETETTIPATDETVPAETVEDTITEEAASATTITLGSKVVGKELGGGKSASYEFTLSSPAKVELLVSATSWSDDWKISIKGETPVTEQLIYVGPWGSYYEYEYRYVYILPKGTYTIYMDNGRYGFWSYSFYANRYEHICIYSNVKKYAPTCTSEGYTKYTCPDCGTSYKTDYVDKLPHNEVYADEIPATCTAEGKKAGSYCTACNKVFSGRETIPMIPHKYVDNVCTSCGLMRGTCGTNLAWTLDTNGKLTITGSGSMSNYELNSAPWYSERDRIKTISLPADLISIGSFAFQRTAITGITIPKSVTAIGEGAFYNCEKLTKITIPETVTKLDGYAFYACTALKEVSLSKNLTALADGTFCGCSALTSVSIPSGVTSIGKHLFSDCVSLKSVSLPSGVTMLPAELFSGCKALTSVTLPSNITAIPDGLLSGCEALTSVTIPSGVTTIGKEAFMGCGALKKITIPEGVTSIGDFAFSGCATLKELHIPAAVTSLGWQAFAACTGLTTLCIAGDAPTMGAGVFRNITASIHYDNEAAGWETVVTSGYGGSISWSTEHTYKAVKTDYTCTEKGYTTHTCACGNQYIDSYVDAAHRISNGICTKCRKAGTCGTSLTWELDEETKTLTISGTGSMKNYEDYDDTPWWGLAAKHLVLSEGVKTIGNNAFHNSALQTIVIPKSLYHIGDYAFWNSDFEEITIPANVTSGGENAFGSCNKLKKVVLDCPRTLDCMFIQCFALTEVVFTNNVKTIGAGTFSSCRGLTEITLPSSVTRIEGVCKVQNNPNVTRVGGAFNDCSNLVSVTLPEGLTFIGYNAFQSCKNLTSITIPSAVTEIDYYAFNECSSLKTVYFQGSAPTVQYPFYKVTATVYYPSAYASSWSSIISKNWSGITWVKHSPLYRTQLWRVEAFRRARLRKARRGHQSLRQL